jgi:teichuronic acid biosynthesis glycosyltransferase TuaC
VRVLTVTNLTPDEHSPHRGRWVADQVDAIREAGVDVQLFGFPSGRPHYLPAVRHLRRLTRAHEFDLVHAHYGLAGWCAHLAGARPLMVTFHGTDVRHRVVGPLSRRLAGRIDLCATVSRALFGPEGGRPGLGRQPGRSAVLPCGPDLDRFSPMPRGEARAALGLLAGRRYLLFPADPARPLKRHDLALELADLAGAELLTAGAIPPDAMPLWVNAADAVLVTSEYEGFGLAALEALACDVAVLSTPVGIAPSIVGSVPGCFVAPYDRERWQAALRPLLDQEDPRVPGRELAQAFSARRMAARVLVAYRELLDRIGAPGGE